MSEMWGAHGGGGFHRTAQAREVIEKILKHCGLWRVSAPRAPPQAHDDATHEVTHVDLDTLVATFEFTE
jgi:hypothetical protein